MAFFSPEEKFIRAVREGSISRIKQALNEGADVNYVEFSGDFALLCAAKNDLLDVAKLLIERGADVNLQNKDGKSALMESSYHASLSVTELLLKKGAEVNLRSEDGQNAMILACSSTKARKQADHVKVLLKHGADVNIQDKGGWSALMRACESSQNYPVRILLEHGAIADVANSDGKTALMISCDSDDIRAMKLLLDSGSQVNMTDREGQSALILACCSTKSGCAEYVTTLLNHGADVNLQDKEGWSALMRTSDYDSAAALLRNGAEVNLQNKEGQTALMTCSNPSIASLLISHQANINHQDNEGYSALIRACWWNNDSVVRCLLRNGADTNLQNKNGLTALMIGILSSTLLEMLITSPNVDVNIQDSWGLSALMRACEIGLPDSVEKLIKNGANVNLGDNNGQTALMKTRDTIDSAIVRLLLESGADVDLQDNDRRSALLRACENFESEKVHHLLLAKANVNLMTKNGLTPLMIACSRGSMVQNYLNINQLLHHKAKVNITDNEGKSALMHVISGEHKDKKNIAFLLLQHKANVNLQDKQGKSALILVCEKELFHRGLTSLLLEPQYGANLDLQDSEGFSALMRACERGHKWIISKLLSRNANKNLQSKNGLSALMIACQKGFSDIINFFLYIGVEVDSTDNEGKSALMHASEHGHTAVVKLLLERGANINKQDQHGNSALMTACKYGHLDSSSMLLKSEANMYLKNSEGKSALDLVTDSNALSVFTKTTTDPSLPGILFLAGARREKVVNYYKTINLEEEGITLSIPEDALLSTDPPLDIQVRPCLSGPFEVPEDLELVSPVYIVKPSRRVKFRKEVLVKIWHHANLETEEDCEDMVFLSASTTPKYRGTRSVYVFREISGVKGLFRPGEEQPVGEIALKHFCGLALGKRKCKNSDKDVSNQKRSKGNLYSVRLYGAMEGKMIFCVCLYQPHYIRTCNAVIARRHGVITNKDYPVLNGVRIVKNEVCIRKSEAEGWEMFFDKEPAAILKDDIDSQEMYEIKDLIDMDYPPQIVIRVRNSPRTVNLAPLRLYVEGLNKDFSFVLHPGDFRIHYETTDQAMGYQVKHLDTSEIKHALRELKEEVQQQSCTLLSTSNDNASLIYTSTQMLLMMENIESMIHDRNCTETMVTKLNEMIIKTQQLKQDTKQICDKLKVNYDVAIYVETTNMLAVQLKINYMANKRHSTTSEWKAAMSVFVANAADLMRSIRKVLVATKYALAIPNNFVTPLTPTTPTVPPQHELLTQLQAVTSASQQTPQRAYNTDQKRAYQFQLPPSGYFPPSTFMGNYPTLAANNHATTLSYPHPSIPTPSTRGSSSSMMGACSQGSNILLPYLGSGEVSSSASIPLQMPVHRDEQQQMPVHRDQQQHGCIDASSFTSHDLLPEPNTGPAPITMQAQHFNFPPTLPIQTASAQLECAPSALSPAQVQSPGFKVQSPHQPLCIQDTKEVRHCLDSLTAQWEYIALELDISPDTIDIIKANHQDIRARLLEMIKLWLRQTTPPPTWQALADAVQYIDSNKAQEIRHKISSIAKIPSSLV